MVDFILIVKNGSDEEEIENLKGTSTMKSMVRAIKMKYEIDARTYGLFNLQYSDGEEFYKDKEIEFSTCEDEITLEDFFGNSEGAVIIYDPIHAGPSDLYIGNATDENLIAEIRYGTINRQSIKESRDVELNPTVNVTEMSGALGIHWQSGNDYYEASLVQQNLVEQTNLNAHCPGKMQQIVLNNGHREGAGAVYVVIHRNKEDIKSNKDPVIYFKVEPGETWVLFPGVGKHIRHGKTKRKMFRKKQQKWVTEDDQDRDPHACLKKGENCRVQNCLNRAIRDGSMIGKEHRQLLAGEECKTCGRYTQEN